MRLIAFEQVCKSFSGRKVLDSVSLSIMKGECIALLGRSGCGKSTLLKILLGIYSPDSGRVLYEGQPVDTNRLRTVAGYASQENSFYDTLTVKENMKYYASRHRVRLNRAQLSALVASVQLSEAQDTLAAKLSGGMKRRLDIALSLVHDPDILILDEPTTGLDPLLVEDFWKLVKGLQSRGKTVIVVTHHLDDVARYCDRAVILRQGKVKSVLSSTQSVHAAFRRSA